MDTRRRTGKLALIVILGLLLQSSIIVTLIVALLGPSATRIPERLAGGSGTSKVEALSVAQLFLRLVADNKFNLACTQVMVSGLVNPCMDDLKSRDLALVAQAGSSIVVMDAKVTQSKATVVGNDTRPAIKGTFALGLQLVDQRWLVETIDGMRIVGSP